MSLPGDEKISRLAQRALDLAEDETVPDATKLQQLRWIAQDDHDLLKKAGDAAFAAEETLRHRGRAVELLARVQYGEAEETS